MGIYDRDYYRDDVRQYSWGAYAGWSITTWLIVINVAVYVLDWFLTTQGKYMVLMSGNNPVVMSNGQLLVMSPLKALGHFSMLKAVDDWQIWRVVTFQFLHGSFMHLLVNMYTLFLFGPIMEEYFGRWRYIWFYLLSGIGGALGYTFLYETQVLQHCPPYATLVGASAGIFGILIGSAMVAPDERLITFPFFIPIKLRTLAVIMICFSVYTIMTQGDNAGGEAGHLGGALVGFSLMKYPRWLSLIDWMSPAQTKIRTHRGSWERKVQRQSDLNAEVDRILDKVKLSGMSSLTSEEKKTLNRASEKWR